MSSQRSGSQQGNKTMNFSIKSLLATSNPSVIGGALIEMSSILQAPPAVRVTSVQPSDWSKVVRARKAMYSILPTEEQEVLFYLEPPYSLLS
jgi:hypothetical protein